MSGCTAALSCFAVSVFVVAFAGFALTASATEDPVPLYRQSQAAELQSPLDSVNLSTFPEPKGLHLNGLKFSPYATEDATYTDNSIRASKNRLDDILVESAGGFSVTYRANECAKFALNYEFGWHDYELGTAMSYSSQQAGFSTQLDRVGVEGLSLFFSEQYLQTGNSSALENEIVQFTHYQSNRAAARSAYAFNRFKISGEYSYALTDYFDRVNSASNFRTHTGDLEIAWDFVPKRFELFENFELQRTLYDRDAYSDFDAYTLSTGVRGVYSKLSYSIAVGYSYEAPIFHTGVRGDASVLATIGYALNRRLSFDLTGSRAFVPDVRTGATLENDMSAAMKMVLTSRGKLALTYSRNESDRLSGVQQISVAYSTRFDYKITRNASMIFGYTRYERSSSTANDGFTANEIRLGFKLAW